MKTKKLLTLIAFTLLAIITTGKAYAQDTPPAGSPVIELTATTAGALVRMRMKAAAANTPVWIETAPHLPNSNSRYKLSDRLYKLHTRRNQPKSIWKYHRLWL